MNFFYIIKLFQNKGVQRSSPWFMNQANIFINIHNNCDSSFHYFLFQILLRNNNIFLIFLVKTVGSEITWFASLKKPYVNEIGIWVMLNGCGFFSLAEKTLISVSLSIFMNGFLKFKRPRRDDM